MYFCCEALFVFALFFQFDIIWGRQSYENVDHYKEKSICKTEHCKKISEVLLKDMDVTADPCFDFYTFACGNYVRTHPLPPGDTFVSVMSEMEKLVESQIKDILESPVHHKDPLAVIESKRIYSYCMDTERIDLDGPNIILTELEKLGGWPIMILPSEWNVPNDKYWQGIMTYLSMITSNGIFNVYTDVNLKLSDCRIITIDEGEFTFPREIYLDLEKHSTKFNAYKKYITEVVRYLLKTMVYTVSSRKIEDDVNNIINLEIELAKLTLKPADREKFDKTYNIMNIYEFQIAYDENQPENEHAKIEWLNYLSAVYSMAGISLDALEPITIRSPEYVYGLSKILDSVSQRTIVNYILWHFVRQSIDYCDSELQTIKFNFERKIYGMSQKPPREHVCLNGINLSDAVSYAYVQNHFNDTLFDEVHYMVNEIRSVLKYQIKHSKWVDLETKQRFLTKLENIREFVGYPGWYTEEAIEEYFERYEKIPDYYENTYYGMVLKLKLFNTVYNLAKLHQLVDKDSWDATPTTVNTFYVRTANKIVLTAAVLQGTVFDPHRPEAMNYGVLGFMIAHELARGYNIYGHIFDKDGNLMEDWPTQIQKIYAEKATCFREQYNSYAIPELSHSHKPTVFIDGELTLDENVADVTGLMAAYYAYQHKKGKIKNDERLIGLEKYNSNQLFFIAFGHQFCEHIKPSYLELLIKEETHSTHHIRVLGSVVNTREFGKIFNCAEDSPIALFKKCNFWD